MVLSCVKRYTNRDLKRVSKVLYISQINLCPFIKNFSKIIIDRAYTVGIHRLVIMTTFGLGSDLQMKLAAFNRTEGARKRYYALDMKQAAQVYDYFYYGERYISICRKIKYKHVFKGGLSVVWGGGILESADTDDAFQEQELISLLQKALDYRDMFGLCPVKLVREKSTGRIRPVIPEFGTGAFVLVLTLETLQTHVIFVPYPSKEPFGTSIDSTKSLEALSLRVYVWPGHEPSLLGQRLKSKISVLFEEYLAVEELKGNALDGDWEATHPTIFTQSKHVTGDMSALTEEETFADADCPALNLGEKQTYRRDIFRSRRMEIFTKRSNVQTQIQESGTNEGTMKRKIDPRTMNIVEAKRKRVWEDNIEPLPAGEEMASQPFPKPRSDFLAWRATYEETVCLEIGIPKSYALGHAAKFKSDAEQQQDIVRSTVESDREDVEMFYQWIYNISYRREDNATILNALLNVDAKKKDAIQNNARDAVKKLKGVKKNLKRIASMPHRVELVFAEDPFPKSVDLAAVTMGSEREAITPHEEINLIRNRLLLEKVDETDELVKIRSEQRRMTREQAEIQHKNFKKEISMTPTPSSQEPLDQAPKKQKKVPDSSKEKTVS